MQEVSERLALENLPQSRVTILMIHYVTLRSWLLPDSSFFLLIMPAKLLSHGGEEPIGVAGVAPRVKAPAELRAVRNLSSTLGHHRPYRGCQPLRLW